MSEVNFVCSWCINLTAWNFHFCRKLMNRVAAQNARDRKKNYVIDLERRLAELEAKVCTHTRTQIHLVLPISLLEC